MTPHKCRECGNDVSSDGKTCPKCETRVKKKKTNSLTWVIAGLLGVGFLSSTMSTDKTPAPTTTQRTAEVSVAVPASVVIAVPKPPPSAASAVAEGEALVKRENEGDAWGRATLAGKSPATPPVPLIDKVEWADVREDVWASGPQNTTLALDAAVAMTSALAWADVVPGAVYVLSNQAAGNKVWVYARHEGGELSFVGSVATGGLGTITPPPNGAPGIDPLASQGALVYHDGLLIVVNAGSNDISLFRAEDDGLQLMDRVPSGGVTPTGVAVRGGLVYVQNAGGTPNISGFLLDAAHRHLSPLPNSTVPLPGGTAAGPGGVSFAVHGEFLVVTEKGTNLIDTFRLDGHGRATLASSSAAVGNVPFGFSLTQAENLVVADAGSGAVSSYRLRHDGSLQTISGAISLDGQTAPCWLVATTSGRYAFTGNSGTQSISALSVSPDGAVALLHGVAASTNGAALDLGLTADGRFLYVRSAQGANASLPGTVSGFKVGQDGSLTAINSLSNLPPGAQEIAVR